MTKYEKLKPMYSVHTLVDFSKVLNDIEKYYDTCKKMNILLKEPENFVINLMNLLDNDEKVIEIISLIHAIQYRDFTKKTGIATKSQIRSADIVTFCEETGFLSFLTTSKINDIYSYIAGCSVGLDSNARKNRSGKEMSGIVLELLSNDHNIEHIEQEITIDKLNERYNYNVKLSANNKRFDFSFIYKNKLYLVEANQYKGGGSKINEVSRSYRKMNDEIQKIKNVEFVWITDGRGWESAKNDFQLNCDKIKYFMVTKEIEEANGISKLL